MARVDGRHGGGDRRIFVRPVETCARQQLYRPMIQPRMDAVAVELDFVQPVVAFRRRIDQLGQLRRDPFQHRGRIGAPPARYGARHDGMGLLPGRCMRLVEMIDLADMLGGMRELEADCLSERNLPT